MGKIAMQILPPLLLVGLAIVPFAPFVFLAWLAGFACAFISGIRLLRMGWAGLRKRPVDAFRAIRPALTVVLFTAVARDENRSVTSREGLRIDYKLLPDRSGFRITVVHALEWTRDFDGGVGKSLTEHEVIR